MPVEPIRKRAPRAPLPTRRDGADDAEGLSHDELVAALRSVEGLRDTGKAAPNFHFRSRPFLHFHVTPEGRTYADVRLGTADFQPVWASTPGERAELLARVCEHVERIARSRKQAKR